MEFPLGTPQMRCQYQSCSFAQCILDCWQCLSYTRVVRNAAIFSQWHVEIYAHENSMALKFQVLNGKFGHAFLSYDCHLQPLFRHEMDQIAYATGVAPLIV